MFDKNKTSKFPEPYQCYSSPPEKKQCHPERPSPFSLLECSGNAVDSLPFPTAWYWTVNRVSKWLENDLDLPQYVEAFQINTINGQKLALLNSNRLVRMNIHDFEDIKKIMKDRRKLFGIDLIEINRSISLPPRKPMTHFYLYSANKGRIGEAISRVSLFRMMHIVQPYPIKPTHWEKIDTEKPEFPKNTIGYVHRPFPKPIVSMLLSRP